MATGGEVLTMLCPDKEWVIYGDDYDSIQWIVGDPITKAQFEAGFAKVDAWKEAEAKKATAAKTALLEKLGISEAEARLLLS
jgi:hypothetical protein